MDRNNPGAIDFDSSFFSYRIEKSKNNKDVLVINEKYIHSKFSPENEGNQFVFKGRNLIVIFGIGLGYHVNNIVKNNPDSIFIIYEPIKEIYNLSEQYLDKLIFNNSNILIITNIMEDKIYAFIEDRNIFSEGRIYIYSNLGYKNLFPELETFFFQSIKKSFEIIIQNILTESSFIPLWTKNFINNSTSLYKYPLINPDIPKIGNNLAVIVCAGPSLNEEIGYLKMFRDKITIFAVDTAIKPLSKNKIIPDFVISLDGQFYSYDDFTKQGNEETVFIFDLLSYPKAVNLTKKNFFTVTKNIFKESFIEYFFNFFNIKEFGIPTGGTVSDYVLSFCVNLGFKNIYLTGLDLSFPNLVTHAKNTPYHEKVLSNSNYFDTPEGLMIKAIAARNIKVSESKIENKKILSDFVLENYAFYFEKFQEQFPDINIYNSQQYGLNIKNLKNIDIKGLLKEINSKRCFSKELLENCDKYFISLKDLNLFYDKTINSLFDSTQELKDLLENNENGNQSILIQWKKLLENLYTNFPFLKKYSITTQMYLCKNNIGEDDLIYYKQIGHNILQSIYYVIRILQKSKKSL